MSQEFQESVQSNFMETAIEFLRKANECVLSNGSIDASTYFLPQADFEQIR